jgi:hypothetical protein
MNFMPQSRGTPRQTGSTRGARTPDPKPNPRTAARGRVGLRFAPCIPECFSRLPEMSRRLSPHPEGGDQHQAGLRKMVSRPAPEVGVKRPSRPRSRFETPDGFTPFAGGGREATVSATKPIRDSGWFHAFTGGGREATVSATKPIRDSGWFHALRRRWA